MTDQQLADKMAQIIRVGFVNARQPEKMRVKVTIPDTTGAELVTDFLPVLCPRACEDMQYDLPDVGDQVLCLFLSYGLEQGFVIGAMYGKQAPPVQSGDKWHRTFKDGAVLEYDRANHSLNAVIPGTATIKCDGPITLEAPIVYVRGTLVNTAKDGSPGKSVFSGGMTVTDGGVNVPDADVQASGVSLTSHTTEGVQTGNDTSKHPTGGSASSPGTEALAVPAFASAVYSAYVASHLEVITKDKKVEVNPINELILCLPKIASAMAENDKNALDRMGWIYLHDFFEKWLASPANNNPYLPGIEPMRVNFDWLVAFRRSSGKYQELIQPEILYSRNAQLLLKERLKTAGKFTDKEEEFDFINIPWWEWRKKYYQSMAVPGQNWSIDIGLDMVVADGLQIAMASFMLYALASGSIIPYQSNKYKIVIKQVGIVGFDTFNFDGIQGYFNWRCAPPDWSFLKRDGYRELTNEDFKNFQRDTGRGGAFSVIAGPKLLDIKEGFSYDLSL